MMYDATFKIILFGESGVERTSLTQRFLTNLFTSDSRMTIGVDFEVKSLELEGKKIKLQIWDLGGEKRFRFLLPTYVRGAKGAIFIYDVNNRASLMSIDDWLSTIKKEIREEDFFPILVMGLVSNEGRQVSIEEGIAIAKSKGVDGFIECIIKTGENVEIAFEALTRLMIDRIEHEGEPIIGERYENIISHTEESIKEKEEYIRKRIEKKPIRKRDEIDEFFERHPELFPKFDEVVLKKRRCKSFKKRGKKLLKDIKI